MFKVFSLLKQQITLKVRRVRKRRVKLKKWKDLEFKYGIKKSVIQYSKSQCYQDVLVLQALKYKRKGYFVDVGASDGEKFSNSWILEKIYGWNGILVEPAKTWHKPLHQNRGTTIDKRAIYKKSKERVDFHQVQIGELSTIDEYVGSDTHRERRLNSIVYSVQTVTLNELLRYHKAPRTIDYVSIDIEGAEWDAISTFNFEEYNVLIWTIEHNFTKNREKIFNLMTNKGYIRIFEEETKFDDFYVRKIDLNSFLKTIDLP
jgi:FkbM family methyltransferase